MQFRLLGPFEAAREGVELDLPAGKQRALLAVLLLSANRTVPQAGLVDELWEGAPPETAAKMVQVYVSRLRKALPDGRLETRGGGYAVRVEPDELDVERFEGLLAEAHASPPETAAETLREALSLWRGPALAEFDEPFARVESARLEELRLGAIEGRLAADLALGRHAQVGAELEALVKRHPLREGFRGQLMRALAGTGRHAEALASYRAYRAKLSDELGIEPSPALRELERQILAHDASLAPATGRPAARAERAAPPKPPPPVSYARSGDVSIAYQTVGDGPLDIVLAHGWICSFQPGWENPTIAGFYRRVAALGRLILFDKRGTGLSDRVSIDRLPDLETRMDDVRAVMDAVESERAVLIGISEGGPMSALFASTYPDRTTALVLMSSFARRLSAPDYPYGEAEDVVQARMAIPEDANWAAATAKEWLTRVAPAAARDPESLRWYASYVARGASPGAVRALRLMNNEIDVRHVLGAIHVPTLVVCREDEYTYYRGTSHYLAERIPGAEFVELPGDEHLPWEGDQAALLEVIGDFLSGVRAEAHVDRVLATVLFTDIVGSTARAAEMGDAAWRALLARHDRLTRAQLSRFRGREVKTTGDGFLALFDGPARAVRCAAAIARAVRSLGLEVRAGLHTGEVELADEDVHGIAVHIGARVAAEAGAGEVLVSQTVRDLVAGSGLEFEDRGLHALAGVPGEWRLAALREPIGISAAPTSSAPSTSPNAS